MGSLVHFRRKLDSLVLEEVKQQARQSWLSSQTMPTEIVDALVAEVEQLRRELHDERVRRDEWEKMYYQAVTGVKVEQRATHAEALAASTREAAEWLWGFWDGNTLVAKPGYEDDIREAWDRLLAATGGVETISLLDRLERAEGLAALVNEETAKLLEQLAHLVHLYLAHRHAFCNTADHACALAARIREALK